jgi:DNA-directed RNA polymerase subunit beta'
VTDVTTVGNLLVNDALPEDMRKAQHVLDKKGAHKLFLELYEKHPDKYVEVLEKLSNVGRETGWTEGISVSLSGLLESKKKKELVAALRPRINAIIDDDSLDADTRKKMIVDELLKAAPQITDEVVKEATDENNPFAVQMASGGRGKKSDINSLRGADLLVMDQNDEFLPVPLWNGFGQGLSPAEAFAASYVQRKGMLTVKLGVGQAGYYGKRLANAAHRIVITRDKPDPTRLPVGLPTTTSDKENIGAVLAHPVGKLFSRFR